MRCECISIAQERGGQAPAPLDCWNLGLPTMSSPSQAYNHISCSEMRQRVGAFQIMAELVQTQLLMGTLENVCQELSQKLPAAVGMRTATGVRLD